MKVHNVHGRHLPATPAEVGALLASLASPDDRLWPTDRWPRMRLDGPLAPGARGGHGPIRYVVDAYEPERLVCFRFTAPAGFVGTHAFVVEPVAEGGVVLRHELSMQARGTARLTWPLVIRPLHDALIEDALDRTGAAFGQPPNAQAWSLRVRLLRGLLRPGGALRGLHAVVGVLAAAAFGFTGLYLHFRLGRLQAFDDFPRLLYRSVHIYLLFSALLNLALGAYLVAARTTAQRVLQWLGSALLLAAPLVFLYGFFVEAPLGLIDRPATFWAVRGSAAGVVLHVVAMLPVRGAFASALDRAGRRPAASPLQPR